MICLTREGQDAIKSIQINGLKHILNDKRFKTFQQFVDFFSDVEVVRGDRGKKLMLAFLIDSKEMNNTVATLNWLEATLGADAFREMFPVILTDNGCEFADPELFETGKDGQRRTRLYYCEPRHSEQKGALEKNHEYIRYVLPKGTSFDELTQEKVLLMVNHINNTTRPKLHGSTPMKKALQSFDKNVMEKLGLEIILPDDICLKPDLLK